jgi:sec-independent protein translocase protein TatC
MSDATLPAGDLAGAHDDHELPKMSFLDHLEELRKRLLVSMIAVLAGFFLSWHYAEQIFGWIAAPLSQYMHGDKLAYTRLTEPFMLYMKVAFFAGIFIASPIIILQIWLFIAPGLYKRERQWAVPFILFATLFFLGGGYFGYRLLLPATCKFFLDTGSQFKQMIKADEYFSFASTVILAAGVVFETPVLIFLLARIGIVTPVFLMRGWKIAIVGSFIIAAFVTPTPDMVMQSALALPMIALYFLGVGIAFVFGKRHDT